MSGVWFGSVCVVLFLVTLLLLAVWTLDRRRSYLRLVGPAPMMLAIALIVQSLSDISILWRVDISTLIMIVAALLTWQGFTQREGRSLGRPTVIGVLAIAVPALVVATVARNPLWVLHVQDLAVASITAIGLYKSGLVTAPRRGNTILGMAVITIAGIFVVRSWIGIDADALNQGQGPDLGGWSGWVYVSFAGLSFAIGAIVAVQEVTDVVAKLRAERDVDHLTGLLNRRGFETQVAHRMRAASDGFALILSDIDHFKRVNDTLGHAAGDTVLASYGSLIRDHCHDGILGRVGGEEFAILLTVETVERARSVAEQLRVAFGTHEFGSTSCEFRATVSVGVAVCAPGVTYHQLFAAADRCLYLAKSSGRNTTWPDIPTLTA